MPTNLVFLTGSVSQLDEQSQSADAQRLQFKLLTIESWVNRATGKQYQHREAINCSVRDRLSVPGASNLAIGTELMVEGKIRTRKWTDKKSATTGFATEVSVTKLLVLQRSDSAVESPREAVLDAATPPTERVMVAPEMGSERDEAGVAIS